MKALLGRESRGVLTQLAWSEVLLAFDFDGTLAPIVADRDAAEMRPETRRLLARICGRYPAAVISGRAKDDVAARLGGAAVKYIVGNHGLEPGGDLANLEEQMEEVRPLLTASLVSVAGLDVEDKRYSLAVHYRRSRNKRVARVAIDRAVAGLPQRMRVVPGKLVVNVVPASAPNKGDALLDLREREGASTALYVGDDVTDEDVFRIDQPGRLLSVRVGESTTSSARYFLRDQREIDALLARLLELREEEDDR